VTDEAAKTGLDHLQSAALELIAAARSFLDVAEELVREPEASAAVVKAAAGVAAAVLGGGQAPPDRGGDPAATSPVGNDSTVEHIEVS
jgi:hypothetical protein